MSINNLDTIYANLCLQLSQGGTSFDLQTESQLESGTNKPRSGRAKRFSPLGLRQGKMAIMIKAKNVKNPVAKVETKKTVKSPSVKVETKKTAKSSAKTEAKKAGREPIAKKLFLSREAAALHAMQGIDLIPCFWAGNSCHGGSEYANGVLAQESKIKSAKLTAVKGWFLVASSEKGARCVPVRARNGQIYERLRDGITVVRGDASLVSAHVGDVASCEKWLKSKVKKGLTDFWRSADGSKETARKAGFACF